MSEMPGASQNEDLPVADNGKCIHQQQRLGVPDNVPRAQQQHRLQEHLLVVGVAQHPRCTDEQRGMHQPLGGTVRQRVSTTEQTHIEDKVSPWKMYRCKRHREGSVAG